MEAIFSKEGEYNKNNGQQLLALPVYVKIVPAGSIAECRAIATPEAEEPQQEAEKAQPEAEKPPQPKLAFLGCGGVFTDDRKDIQIVCSRRLSRRSVRRTYLGARILSHEGQP